MKIGHVHGRFQPFHTGHKSYVKWANQQCDRLIIGITNADPSHIDVEDADPDRHKEENNPYTYFERQRMITAFIDSDLFNGAAYITPFPINKPELWQHYVPASATHYIRVLEEWHEEKVERIQEHGREVVSERHERVVSGTNIRKKMRNDEEWESEVPAPVVDIIRSFNMELPRKH